MGSYREGAPGFLNGPWFKKKKKFSMFMKRFPRGEGSEKFLVFLRRFPRLSGS